MSNNTNASLIPYLFFSGNCREVMEFYREALDGSVEYSTFKDSPMDVGEEYNEKIMHSTLNFGDNVLMASDSLPDSNAGKAQGFSLSINYDNLQDAQHYFNKLSKDGNVTMPLEPSFWGAIFGMFTDKYGTSWMVSCPGEEQDSNS